MSENTENQAAQVDPLDAFVDEVIDQDSEQNTEESAPVESAPQQKIQKSQNQTKLKSQKRMDFKNVSTK